MARIFGGAELGLTEPAEMNPETYQEWLKSLQRPDGSWAAGFSTNSLTELTGITYRQADYWAHRGALVPEIFQAQGSGTARIYSFENVCQGALMRHLTGAADEVADGWGYSFETAASAAESIRLSGRRICEAAGVLAPSPRHEGPLVLEHKVPANLEDYVVMSARDLRVIAAVAVKAVIWLPEAA